MNPRMAAEGKRKPYLDAWLKRTGRELGSSGKLSELALVLAGRTGSGADEWREWLRRILAREEEPGLDLLTEIDSILARPAKGNPMATPEPDLFD